MQHGAGNRGDRLGMLAGAVAVCLTLAGATVTVAAVRTPQGPPEPASAAAEAPLESRHGHRHSSTERIANGAGRRPERRTPATPDFGPSASRSRPVRVSIPGIRLRTERIVSLGLTRSGGLATPANYDAIGWYRHGPTPGEIGPAVLAGHVDSPSGPAVFWHLGALHRDMVVEVLRADGSVAVFTIDTVRSYSRDQFPTTAVYGSTPRAELRLITCGGSYDDGTDSYSDNVIVFAHLERVLNRGSEPPPR